VVARIRGCYINPFLTTFAGQQNRPDLIDVSLIIVNYKTPQLIRDCLQTVYAFTKGVHFEVIVVDNDSQDNSRAVVQGQFPQVRWFDTGYNAGFSRANNFGIDHATGRNILLLNSDTLLVDDLLTRLCGVLDQQPDVAAVGAMQINRAGEVHHQIYDTFGKIRRHFYVLPQSDFFRKLLYKLFPDPHYDDPNEVDWLSGACIMTRPSVMAKAGRLDESFFMYGEDVEWGYRLGKQGRLLMLRDAFVVHLEFGSTTDYQQHVPTHINRFKTQAQVSNLLWIRKQYGIGAYLVLLTHYLALVPIIYFWKITVNVRNGQSPLGDLDTQNLFASQVRTYLRFMPNTLLNRKGFYKV
jgi:GT2 family glycosyltransferase